MGAEVVIGVDLNHERGKGNESTKLLATLQSTWNIITVGTMYKGYHNSDVVIKPELGAYKNTELDHLDEMVEEGYRAAMRAMPEIKETLLLKWRRLREWACNETLNLVCMDIICNFM